MPPDDSNPARLSALPRRRCQVSRMAWDTSGSTLSWPAASAMTRASRAPSTAAPASTAGWLMARRSSSVAHRADEELRVPQRVDQRGCVLAAAGIEVRADAEDHAGPAVGRPRRGDDQLDEAGALPLVRGTA